MMFFFIYLRVLFGNIPLVIKVKINLTSSKFYNLKKIYILKTRNSNFKNIKMSIQSSHKFSSVKSLTQL